MYMKSQFEKYLKSIIFYIKYFSMYIDTKNFILLKKIYM